MLWEKKRISVRNCKEFGKQMYKLKKSIAIQLLSGTMYQLKHFLVPRQLRLYLKVVKILVNPPVPVPVNCYCADYLDK